MISDSQKCFRSVDIEEVGDNRHTTFFEMLGNWSLGGYFKEEQISWMFEFLTNEIGLDPKKLYITVFVGDEKNNIPKDVESAAIWQKLFATKGIEAKGVEIGSEENGYKVGMRGGRIFYYDTKKNWWSRSGVPENMPVGEPGGPDSEMFYEFTEVEHDKKFGEHCHPNCDCGRFLEIGNNVFMEYVKNADGTFSKLPQRNVDFGGGLERLVMAKNNIADVIKTNHQPILNYIENVSGKIYSKNPAETKAFRIIADHMKAATFLIADGVLPSNSYR
jgi:alanyl-tRNA synthetase